MYDAWSKAQAEVERARQEMTAAELVAKAEAAIEEQDYEGAIVFYLMAMEKYEELEDKAQIAALKKKIEALEEKQAQEQSSVSGNN